MSPHDGGRDEGVTNGELFRLCLAIKQDVHAVDAKVDRQQDTVTSINLRLTAIEARQSEPSEPSQERRRSYSKPIAGGAGIGALVLGLVQWVIAHWR